MPPTKRRDIFGNPYPKQRKFDGKTYSSNSIAYGKMDLREQTKRLQRYGYSVRSVKIGRRYQIYRRKGN